ncbi:hypothetical protein VHEMI00257 [[Torrubiella] hemipterigena]|uniref:Uncharacterized protein n=1 Tax=[Torrubiella] hemipterigena TaxID=1531966 RepID=A0A0A1T1E6_9HYPO|nr:hypothetical protein VHEMI00257 [[Torrubiella] hemipterigena]
MKPLISHFAGLSVLLAAIEANELPPQSIPIQCATICGPIVELTALCSKKRSVPIDKSHIRRHLEQPRALEPLPYLRRDTYKHKRLFVTLVPPPAASVPHPQQPTPQPANHPPVSQSQSPNQPPPANPAPPVSQTTQQKPPPPPPQPAPPEPPAQTSQASKPKEKGPVEQPTSSARASRGGGTETAAMSPIPSMKGGGTSMSGMVEGSGGSSPDMDSSKGPEGDEEICVCENRSFDVATLTGLCASCVASKSKLQDAANLELIMSTCDFPEQRYSPDKDKLVNNIVVKALTSGVANNSTTSEGISAPLPTRYSLVPIIGSLFLAALQSL